MKNQNNGQSKHFKYINDQIFFYEKRLEDAEKSYTDLQAIFRNDGNYNSDFNIKQQAELAIINAKAEDIREKVAYLHIVKYTGRVHSVDFFGTEYIKGRSIFRKLVNNLGKIHDAG